MPPFFNKIFLRKFLFYKSFLVLFFFKIFKTIFLFIGSSSFSKILTTKTFSFAGLYFLFLFMFIFILML